MALSIKDPGTDRLIRDLAYALAKATGQPLLYKCEGFGRTDMGAAA